jgi:4-amino-4-deoxy-L-arabinose transferase-like glycosyltransferase
MTATRDVLASLAAAALLVLFALWYAPSLGTGFISHTDEFATLDRSHAMLATGDWGTVHSRNLPSFKKPPLQYWMSAALMEAGVGLPTALRLPSLLFALAGLWAAGFLARTLLPASAWAAPAAILICAGSLAWWSTGTSALLDSGSVFFATLALAATIRALERPAWWYAVAGAVVLGAFQKAPIGLFLVLGYLIVLAFTRASHGIDVGAIRRSRPFRRAVWIVVIGTLAWPLLQIARHSTVTVVEDLLGQTVGRFVPAGFDEDLTDLTGLYGMILGGEPLLRGLGIAALLWLPWRLRRMELLPLPALFGVYVLLMYLAVGNVSGRYTVIFLPLLAAALAAVILSLPLPGVARAGGVLAVSALALGPLKPPARLGLEAPSGQAAAIAALGEVGAALSPEETLVVCNWRPRVFPPGMVTYFAAGGRPFEMPERVGDLAEARADGSLPGALRGLCPTPQFAELAATLPGLSVVSERDGFTHWTAR